jgi:cytochrome c biogenesis protein CcdA
MTTVLAALGHEPQGVPTTIIGEQVWVGFGEGSAETLRRAALHALDPPSPTTEHADPTIVDVPLVGGIDVTRHSLLVATAVIALVDGFNPCSLWALSILLALVLNTRSRRRVAAVGLTFLAVTTILYGVYIIGLYSVLSYVGYLAWIRVAVAALAITFGIINVKDYFAFGRGPSLTISARRKPQLYQRMRYVADPDRPLLPVLGGTAALAVGVSLLETPCTAGFPVLWADLLAEQGVAAATAVALFAVYMVVFLVDELLVLAGAIVAMRVTKMTERHGRLLKLVGGVVMLTLAAVLLFAPQLMESIAGALVVFLAAALVTVAVVALTSRSSAATKQGSRRVPSG